MIFPSLNLNSAWMTLCTLLSVLLKVYLASQWAKPSSPSCRIIFHTKRLMSNLKASRTENWFAATRTSASSPGVSISIAPIWTWKPETPGIVPAGALISAGKSGENQGTWEPCKGFLKEFYQNLLASILWLKCQTKHLVQLKSCLSEKSVNITNRIWCVSPVHCELFKE